MVIEDDLASDVEVQQIAFVDKPAIEKNFMAFDEEWFGGPGSGPNPGGGSGGDDEGDGDTAKILAKPRHERTEDDLKKLYKRKPKKEVKEIADNGKSWLKKNKDKVGSQEHRTVSREVNVADKILNGFFHYVSLHFATDPQRQIVSGPAMVPDTLIYRKDQAGEYNVFFSKETIEKIALKFFKKDYQKNLNLFHDPNLPIQGVTIFESFVSDKSRGIQPMKGFEDLPDGTWFISAKVENPDVWAKIQTGEVKGFSVEGIFSYVKKPKKPKGMYEVNRTEDDNEHFQLDDAKSLIMKVTEFLADIKKKYFDGTPLVNTDHGVAPVQNVPAPPQTLQQDYTTKDGQTVQIDKLEVGGIALMGGVPAPAGELQLQDGTSLMIGEGGVITMVTPAMSPSAAPALTMAQVDLAINAALTRYKEELAAEKLAAQAAQGVFNAEMKKRDNQIAALFSAIEKLAEMPTADPVNEVPVSFSQQKVQDKAEKRNLLIKYLKDKKTA